MFRLKNPVGSRLYIDGTHIKVDPYIQHIEVAMAPVRREGKQIEYAKRYPTSDGRVIPAPPLPLINLAITDEAADSPKFQRFMRLLRRALRVYDADIQRQLDGRQAMVGEEVIDLTVEVDDDPDVIPEDQGLLREIQACTVALDALKVAAQREMDRRDSVRDGEME